MDMVGAMEAMVDPWMANWRQRTTNKEMPNWLTGGSRQDKWEH